MKCERCGWEQDSNDPPAPPEIEGWPEFLPPPPPLPDLGSPHPVGVCPSPWKIGDVLYYDMAGGFPDLPPIRAYFAGINSFSSPSYYLDGDSWVVEEPGYALNGAKIILDKKSVHPDLPYTGDETGMVVLFANLTAAERWPVIVGGHDE